MLSGVVGKFVVSALVIYKYMNYYTANPGQRFLAKSFLLKRGVIQ